MQTGTCSRPIGINQTLEFEMYDRNEGWNNVPGLYIFAYQLTEGWKALYVGQAESLSNRLPGHERLNEAVQAGATHIHAKVVRLANIRDQWEKSLIQYLQPPLNTQHR